MAVAQEVHHGHFHLGPIGGTKPTPPTDVEVEAKVAEAENASVSWKRHVTSKGLGCSFTRDIYTFISVNKVLQGFQLYYGMFVVLLFLLGCFMRVVGIQRGKMSSCLFSFVSNLVNFYDSTEYIYIFIYIYIFTSKNTPYPTISSYHTISYDDVPQKKHVSDVPLIIQGVIDIARCLGIDMAIHGEPDR